MSRFIDFSIIQLALSHSGIENHDHALILSLHIWLVLIVGIELGKATTRSTIWKLSPPILFVLSFIILIATGSSLLMLPEMTVSKQGMHFRDALFTSISANCVTGLIVVDTTTYFSLKGQILILLLIQLGGLNIIAFATYFMSFFQKRITEPRHQTAIRELLHTDNLGNARNMIGTVILTALVIESIGAIILYQQWGTDIGNKSDRLFYSVFHSVSAFNNAGFTLYTDGFLNSNTSSNYSLHITVAFLIVFGGLGFTTLLEIFRLGNTSKLFKSKVIRLSVQSRIATYSSIILIALGTVLFFITERNNTMAQLSTSERLITSFFQSVTARTAGFNTADFGKATTITLLSTMLLMFIGACSGSTGGGIKTSTTSVLLIALFKRKKKKDNYGKSFLTIVLVRKAMVILLSSIAVILIGTFILTLVEPDKGVSELFFEEISAFSTVGLSTGITPSLSSSGKSVLMCSMFLGRLGPLALSYTLVSSLNVIETKQEGNILLG
ncbi:MAG: hypothetical protein JJ975_00925 [Bacteroidia bacterium]|nr:hypothetical protein [Bacteroidia bacterium]